MKLYSSPRLRKTLLGIIVLLAIGAGISGLKANQLGKFGFDLSGPTRFDVYAQTTFVSWPIDCWGLDLPARGDEALRAYKQVMAGESECRNAIAQSQAEERQKYDRYVLVQSINTGLVTILKILIPLWLILILAASRSRLTADLVIPGLAQISDVKHSIGEGTSARIRASRLVQEHGRGAYDAFRQAAHCQSCGHPLRIVVLDSGISRTIPMCEKCGFEQPTLQFPPDDM